MNRLPLTASVFRLSTRLAELVRARSKLVSPVAIVPCFQRAIGWAKRNCLEGKGIKVTNKSDKPYPEVSGYLIPSLLNWGERRQAHSIARWLLSVQNSDGSWSDPSGRMPYTFDTGQILKGLITLVDNQPDFRIPIINGCEWILRQVEQSGRVTTPDKSDWDLPGGGVVPESIHLYALEPLIEATRRWGDQRYAEAVSRALDYYLSQPDVGPFNTLSHFHAYVMEALVDLGRPERAREGMADVARHRLRSGAIPGYRNGRWVCSTGMFQYAVVWYKLGMVEEGDRSFRYACGLQNESGGFFGSYGRRANYFPDQEISWAVKYFLDALWWKIRTSFANSNSLAAFPSSIDEKDGRYQLIKEMAGDLTDRAVLDVGCGKGRFISRLKSSFPGARAYGMDVCNAMLKSLPEGVTPSLGTALDIPFPDSYFDYAFCVESLEHVVNTSAALAELSRVLKPGGTVVIVDKNRANQGQLEIAEWEQWFSESEFANLLDRAGFEVSVRRSIPYDQQDGSDGLFLGWIGKKRGGAGAAPS